MKKQKYSLEPKEGYYEYQACCENCLTLMNIYIPFGVTRASVFKSENIPCSHCKCFLNTPTTGLTPILEQ